MSTLKVKAGSKHIYCLLLYSLKINIDYTVENERHNSAPTPTVTE